MITLDLSRHPIYVVCDDVRSLANVGAIFRLCDAAVVQRLYLCGITGYPIGPGETRPPWVAERANRFIAKTAIHSVQDVPWEHRGDAATTARALKDQGAQIVVLEQTPASVPYTSAPYQFPVAIVVGHERQGVSDPILPLADFAVEIPMHGQGKSLNVAVALGIVLYELIEHHLPAKPGWPDFRDRRPSGDAPIASGS